MKTLSTSNVVRFGFKLGLFLLPVALIAGTFFIADPFKVLYRYDNFYADSDQPGVVLSRGYVSAEIFLRQREQYRYDSFILGSSRSLAFLTEDWITYIGASTPFHFDAFGESLFGVWATVKFMDRLDTPIRNVLFILDPLLLRNVTGAEGLVVKHHPDISGLPRVKFYFKFLRRYLSEGFFIRYLDLKLFKTYRPYMKKYIGPHHFSCDPVTNDCLLGWRDEMIAADPENYFSDKALFYPRDHLEKRGYGVMIKERQLLMLREINAVFKNHHTNFKIVISPLYDQQKIHHSDLESLRSVFGAGNVYDYSGVNPLTSDVKNYYEPQHYRPDVARAILREIYAA